MVRGGGEGVGDLFRASAPIAAQWLGPSNICCEPSASPAVSQSENVISAMLADATTASRVTPAPRVSAHA